MREKEREREREIEKRKEKERDMSTERKIIIKITIIEYGISHTEQLQAMKGKVQNKQETRNDQIQAVR